MRLGSRRRDLPHRRLKVPGRLPRPAEQDVAFADEGPKADRLEERYVRLLAEGSERGYWDRWAAAIERPVGLVGDPPCEGRTTDEPTRAAEANTGQFQDRSTIPAAPRG